MKFSVIIGVAQMALGVCMKCANAAYHGRNLEVIFEFIPQIILLMCLFGFMDLLIIIKWLTDYSVMVGASPPSIISLMVAMFLDFGETTDTLLFSAQVGIMNFLLIVALLCIPTMLFVKPILEYRQFKSEVLETPKVRHISHISNPYHYRFMLKTKTTCLNFTLPSKTTMLTMQVPK